MCVVNVAEYLGQAVPTSASRIEPVLAAKCPFVDIECRKLAKDKKKPVCSVRKPDGRLWIVCRERLCSTGGDGLVPHQRDVLCKIAGEVFDMDPDPDGVIYKKEVNLELPHGKRMRADYILGARNKACGRNRGPGRVIVEIQGGGSTSNTGIMTRHVDQWEKDIGRTNASLGTMLPTVGSIENDSWKRQQDQLITKSHIANASGFGFVLCVGKALSDYICDRLGILDTAQNMRDVDGRWDFVLLPMVEVNDGNRIRFDVDEEGAFYTTFHTFAQLLISQGAAQADKFAGEFHTISGERVVIR